MKRYLRIWKSILQQKRGRLAANILIEKFNVQLGQLQKLQPAIQNRALQAQWDNLISPGLALYRTMRTEGDQSREAVLDEVEILFEASFFTFERRLVRLLNLLPDPYQLVRLGLRRMTINHYLPGASEVIEDSRNCFGVNTYRCFFLDILTQHDAPELIPLYCKTDDWLASAIPKVRWQRTKSLAEGDKLCDFRWYRQNKK